jgi:hypothetical protein
LGPADCRHAPLPDAPDSVRLVANLGANKADAAAHAIDPHTFAIRDRDFRNVTGERVLEFGEVEDSRISSDPPAVSLRSTPPP